MYVKKKGKKKEEKKKEKEKEVVVAAGASRAAGAAGAGAGAGAGAAGEIWRIQRIKFLFLFFSVFFFFFPVAEGRFRLLDPACWKEKKAVGKRGKRWIMMGGSAHLLQFFDNDLKGFCFCYVARWCFGGGEGW